MKKLFLILVLITNLAFSHSFDYNNYSALLKKYVSENGNVNYAKLKENKSELNAVINQFEKNLVKENWTKNQKIAYYINVYNVYTLKAIVDNYPVNSIKKINNVWDKKAIITAKDKISLSDVEHKILRKMGDSRIHFAINCASFSCPDLLNTAYLPETLDYQLEKVTKSFINDKSKNNISTSEVKISQIFNWFSSDFKTKNSGIIDFLNQYAFVKISNNAKIKHLNYNWNLNE